MQIRHEETLTSRLEDAALHGVANITWNELYLWYGVQKIAAGTMRDLARRFDKVVETIKGSRVPNWAEPGRLCYAKGVAGFFIFGDKNGRLLESDELLTKLKQ